MHLDFNAAPITNTGVSDGAAQHALPRAARWDKINRYTVSGTPHLGTAPYPSSTTPGPTFRIASGLVATCRRPPATEGTH